MCAHVTCCIMPACFLGAVISLAIERMLRRALADWSKWQLYRGLTKAAINMHVAEPFAAANAMKEYELYLSGRDGWPGG